jgi:tetratricopeptide (TPR) repeat protein
MNSYFKQPFLNDRAKALLLLLLVAFIYLPFLNNPLVFDDLPFLTSAADAPFNLSVRWFPYTTIGFTWVFFGEAPPVFRVQNLLLHGTNVLLLFLLLRLWISVFITDTSKEKLAEWGAWLGALTFACHPLAVYGVGYLIQRSILMATLFTLVMQLAYLRGLLENNKNYLALAVAAYFLAVFSKEHSVMAPAILLPLTWLLRERIQFSVRTLLLTWLGFALVALLIVMSTKGLLGVAYEADAASLFGQQEKMPQGAYLLSVLTQAGLFFKYCLLMLLPNPAWMSIDMRETFLFSYKEWTSWIGLLAFIAYGLFALRCLFRGGRSALLGLAMLYPWLLFMTEFSSIRVQESFVLYRSYLWMPGFMLLVPLLASVLPSNRVMLVGAVIALLLVPLSWNRLWVLADNYRLWNDAVQLLHGEDRLGSQRTYYNRAQASVVQKNWDAAITDYQKSLSIDASHPQVYMALAIAYYGAKRYTEALAILDKVIALDEKNARAYYNKGVVMNALKDKAGALSNMEKSCALGEMTACAIVSMGQLKSHNAH